MRAAADGPWVLPWLQSSWKQAVAQRGHALLLHGPEGVGQFELAMALAQTWLCESPQPTAEPRPPCGRCEACHQFQAGVHSDLMVLVPEAMRERLGLTGQGEEGSDAGVDGAPSSAKAKSGGREIRVADIRRAIDWGHQTSSRGRGKVLVIHPAQALNRVAANALLKTLEEPAGALRLVLSTADAQALLPTLRSRCQHVALRLPAAEMAVEWLRGQGMGAADVLLQAAAGRPQEALAMAQEGLDARLWPELPAAVRQGRVETFSGLSVSRLLDVLQKVCQDLMAHAQGAPTLYFPAESLPKGAQPLALAAWWQDLLRVSRHAEHPWNAGLLVESLVLKGRLCWPSKSSSSPVARTRHAG